MRRELFFIGVLSLACACAGSKPAPPPSVQLPPKPPPDNLVVLAYEVVEGAEEDCPARVRVFIDSVLAGQTEEGPKSKERAWSARVAPGNRLVRLERWDFPRVWDWVKAEEEAQPPERFVRVRPGMKTTVRLRVSDGGRRRSLEVSQAPQAP